MPLSFCGKSNDLFQWFFEYIDTSHHALPPYYKTVTSSSSFVSRSMQVHTERFLSLRAHLHILLTVANTQVPVRKGVLARDLGMLPKYVDHSCIAV